MRPSPDAEEGRAAATGCAIGGHVGRQVTWVGQPNPELPPHLDFCALPGYESQLAAWLQPELHEGTRTECRLQDSSEVTITNFPSDFLG